MAIVKIHRLPPTMLSQCRQRLTCGLLRTITTSSRLGNHYDALGVTPKSTQGDIKTAYYKLSKLYHPDISSDERSAKKFRAISEAYEVLGNVKLKKMYDRDVYAVTFLAASSLSNAPTDAVVESVESQKLMSKSLLGNQQMPMSEMKYEPEPEPTDPTLKFYKSHANRHMTPTMDGRSQHVYDFDTWSKQHYGTVFHKTQYDKDLIKQRREKKEAVRQARKQEGIIYLFVTVGALFMTYVIHGQADYDRDLVSKEAREKREVERANNLD